MKKARGEEPNLYLTGFLIGGLGLVGETIVELQGQYANFGKTEMVSILLIFTGVVLMALGRYAKIKHDIAKKKRFLTLIGFAVVCFGLAFFIGLYGYFRNI